MQIPDELINQTTANVLKGVMQESGLQQKSWAQKSGISPVTLQKLLSGNQAIKVPQLLALARASVLSPEEVMDRIDEAVKRAVSDAPISLDAHRAKKPADMSDDEIERLGRAAVHDPENDRDQPEDL